MNLKNFIKDVPDYPKPGIIFKDITPLLGDKEAFKFAIDSFAEKFSLPSAVPVPSPAIPAPPSVVTAPPSVIPAKAGIPSHNGEIPHQVRDDGVAVRDDSAKIDVVVGIDARGFLLAAPVAYKLGAGLAIVRKPGKLPRQTIREDYTLEYASNTLEMHQDAILPGQKVVIIDDVLATGGTMEATCKLVKKLGGEIAGIGFLMELGFLNGREKLKDFNIFSLLLY